MSDLKPADITRRIRFDLIEPLDSQSTAEFRYHRDDPFAVEVVFTEAGDQNAWVFARDLLERGLRKPTGVGAVRVCPDVARLMLMLSSPEEGTAVLAFGATEVRRFLAATYRAVPRGEESVDLDGLIEQLLGGAR